MKVILTVVKKVNNAKYLLVKILTKDHFLLNSIFLLKTTFFY